MQERVGDEGDFRLKHHRVLDLLIVSYMMSTNLETFHIWHGGVMEPSGSGATSASLCYRLITPWPRYVLIYNLLMSAPAVLLLVYLVANARASVKKLAQSQSHIMATYYGFLWVVCLLNVCWCLLEVSQAHEDERATAWNVISLVTRSGMILLEVSVVVFLSKGYLVSGWDALLRTLLFSGLFAAADAIIKAVFIFGLGVPLFRMDNDIGDWRKWGFWLLHSCIFAGVYLLILILPHTRWKERLPGKFWIDMSGEPSLPHIIEASGTGGHQVSIHYQKTDDSVSKECDILITRDVDMSAARPSFYQYVFILFVLNVLAVFGSFLLCLKAASGYCIFGLTSFCYYALYPPLLYVTFLSEFFHEEQLQAEDVYYSEMKDAGYFDTDWD